MRLADQIRSVRHTFASNRVRAFLTLLGIMIGAGSIVLLAGLLRGGEEALVRTSQRANEADLIQVRRDEPPTNQLQKTRRTLSSLDADNLQESKPLEGRLVTSEATRESKITAPKKKRVRLVGAEPVALPLYHLEVEQGRFLSADDLRERRRVCVVGQEVWREALESVPTIANSTITVENQEWTVIGVLKNKPLLGGGGDGTWMWNRKVLVPRTTFDAMFSPQHEANRVFVRVGEEGDVDARMRAIEGLVKGTLLRRHLGVENFKIEGEDGEANQERLIFLIIKILLLATGLLSLFVGGINIMNIMLVTVTERTREIGVRRAVGATPGAIMMQFLLEAAFIATVGGVIGVLGGIFFSWLSSVGLSLLVGKWNLHIEPWSIVLGLALSFTTGVVFGLFPAWRAARLDPVEALRYE